MIAHTPSSIHSPLTRSQEISSQPSLSSSLMAEEPNPLPPTADPLNGFDPTTKIFHTLRPTVPLPPLQPPLSASDYLLSLLRPTPDTPYPLTPAFIDFATGSHISYPDFFRQVRSLSCSLQSRFSLSKGHVAFILSPSSFHVPVLYISLLSIGVILAPANPLGTPSEISRQIDLSRPNIVFTTSSYVHKLPSFLTLVVLDSQEFRTMIHEPPSRFHRPDPVIHQLDPAAIFYSSGTTGNVKGVLLTHRNIISVMAGVHTLRTKIDSPAAAAAAAEVSLITVPLFHIFGFFMVLNKTAGGKTVVLMERFDFSGMLKAVEKYKVTNMPVSPPLVVAMAKSPEILKYDLRSLTSIGCGGAPLGKDVAEGFAKRFPGVEIIQGYGLTESSGGATSTMGSDENLHYGSAGRLAENTQAKIVDPDTGETLPPGKQGELWLRGPSIMKGYVGDDKATAATLDKEGWLKTGDLCYFDKEGFLYIVDRLKELIKYKAYQVPPAEIEALLQSHKEIVDAAVIPYPDEEAGQIPMAYVVRQPGSSLNASQVMEFVAKQVAPYKKIRRVEFISEIPKSAAGKILRRELIKHSLSSSSSKL